MKKLINTLFICLFTFSIAFSQLEIPNGDFELGSSADLDNWDLTSGTAQIRNFLNLSGPSGTIIVDPQSGDRMLTLMNGQGSLGVIKNIFPINFRPEVYVFYVGYISGATGEKFGGGICLTKFNSSTGTNDTLLNIIGVFPTSGRQVITWTKYSAILESSYLSSEVPDQATIYFITDVAINQSGNIIATPNTTLALDNIHFEEAGAAAVEGFTYTNIESLSNYPNPFKDATTIRYELLNESQVNLTIYDINGKEVINLVNGKQGRGEHEITLNAVDMK